MDMEQEHSIRERHFVLDLMNFVYAISGKPLQYCLQEMLNEFPKGRESYFSKNITKAILIYINDYRSSNVLLVDLASQSYQNKIEELSKDYDSYDFLKFLAHYSLKSAKEYYNDKLLDSPVKFYSSIIRFLEEMRKNGRWDTEYWKRLEIAAEKIVAKDCKITKSQNRELREVSMDEDMTAEREFVLEVINIVSTAYRNPLPDYSKRAREEFLLTSQFDHYPILEKALNIAMENMERNVCDLGGDEAISEYYYALCKRSFSARDFLEYSVCCARKSLIEYHRDSKKDSPRRSYERLMFVLLNAKRKGNFNSVEDLIRGAHEIIDNERCRIAQLEKRLNTFGFYSDISTESNEPNSDWENLITPCDHVQPDMVRAEISRLFTVNKSRRRKPITQNLTSSEEDSQTTSGNAKVSNKNDKTESVLISKKSPQPCEIAISSGGSGQPNHLVASIFGINFQKFAKKAIASASGENVQLDINSVTASGENVQADINGLTTSGEIVQPDINSVTASGENAQSASDKVVITSSDSTQQASESHNLVSCEHKNETCKCCKNCCTTT